MSVIALPSRVIATVGAQSFGLARYDVSSVSESTGSVAVRVMGPPRWRASLRSGSWLARADAGAWMAMVAALRGGINHLALYDLLAPAPRGTMRGALSLASSASIGATSISVTGGAGQAGTTLLTGDLIQVGTPGVASSQLVMICADATANGSGVIALTIEPPLRLALSAGASVAWDSPLAYYRMTNDTVIWSSVPGSMAREGFALDLLEQWA